LAWAIANKQSLITGVGAAAAAYLAYKAYTSESANKLAKLRNTISNYGAAFGSLSASAALVSSDLHTFLNSDAQELPRSLRQLNKLLQSQEVQDTISSAATSVARGVSHATASTSGAPEGPAMLDKVLEAVLSDRGRSLVGMAVGLATKNATTAFCDFLERMQQRPTVLGEGEGMEPGGASPAFAAVISLLASDQGERIMSLLITKSIKTAVSTYVDATIGYNFYDDMMASISKQEHRDAVTEIMSRVTAAFCREVALAYKKSQRSPSNSFHSSSSSSTVSLSSLAHAAGSAGTSAGGAATTVFVSEGGSVVGRRHSHDSVPANSKPPPAPSAALASSQQQPGAAFPGRGATAALQQALHNQVHGQKANAARAPSPAWLRQVVDLAREQEVRSLALDVVKSATREATRSTIETLVYGNGGSAKGLSSYVQLSTSHVYMLMTVCISLLMYAVAPRTMVL